jgi:hypothetical protein
MIEVGGVVSVGLGWGLVGGLLLVEKRGGATVVCLFLLFVVSGEWGPSSNWILVQNCR